MAYHPSQLDLQIDSIYSTAVPTLSTPNLLSGSYKLNTMTDRGERGGGVGNETGGVSRVQSGQERRREAGRCELR